MHWKFELCPAQTDQRNTHRYSKAEQHDLGREAGRIDAAVLGSGINYLLSQRGDII
jgi:hypothetical protein